jgi:hypothetical protein
VIAFFLIATTHRSEGQLLVTQISSPSGAPGILGPQRASLFIPGRGGPPRDCACPIDLATCGRCGRQTLSRRSQAQCSVIASVLLAMIAVSSSSDSSRGERADIVVLTACGGLPWARSRIEFEARARAAGGAFVSRMIAASVLIASTVYWRATSWTSPRIFGRPPGFPRFMQNF